MLRKGRIIAYPMVFRKKDVDNLFQKRGEVLVKVLRKKMKAQNAKAVIFEYFNPWDINSRIFIYTEDSAIFQQIKIFLEFMGIESVDIGFYKMLYIKSPFIWDVYGLSLIFQKEDIEVVGGE